MTNAPQSAEKPALPAVASTSKPRTFITLDALRGIAALPVLWLHTAHAYGRFTLFPHAHLAVDFFFLLSGFVMAYVYQQRLDAGWRTRDFMQVRFVRLYPLYILGLILGSAFFVLQDHFGKVHRPIQLLAELLFLGLFFLPVPPLPFLPRAGTPMYPYDVPAWSLFFEQVANLFHALFLRRRSIATLATLCGVMALVQLRESIIWNGFDFGPDRTDYLLGMGRTLLSYPMGILLYRLWQTGRGRIEAPTWLIGLVLTALMAAPILRWNGLFEWLAVVVAFPFLLWLGACSQPSMGFVVPARWLGAISYPLYILHVPMFAFFEQVWVHIGHQPMDLAAPWPGLLFLLILFPLVFWIGERYDPEARKLIQSRLPKAAPHSKS